jgi:UDPglucose 6-dehydrogenase
MSSKVCVVGIWHLGAVVSACLAELGYQVIGIERDPERVTLLNRGIPPLFEPGLEELMARHLLSGQLRFTVDFEEEAKDAPYVVISHDTPVNERDEPDISSIVNTVKSLAADLAEGVTLIVSSQVPVGTCESLVGSLRRLNPDLNFGMAYVPENLRLGQAIERFLHPDMLVLGTDGEHTMARVEALYAPINAPRIRVDLRTAEMTKHAINAYLATCISFGNELANLCDEVGANAFQVIKALRLDNRVSPRAPLLPGLGFSGGTLARDLRVLQHLAEQYAYPTPLLNGVLAVNHFQTTTIVHRLEKLLGTLQAKTIGVLGLTYKADTSTLRRSAPIEIILALAAKGAIVKAYDPKAEPKEIEPYLQDFTLCHNPYTVAGGAHALILVTPWPEFKRLDLARLRLLMHSPVLLDAPNMLDPEQVVEAGFVYQGIGRGLTHPGA